MRNLNKKKIALLTACVVSAVGHMAFAAEADNYDEYSGADYVVTATKTQLEKKEVPQSVEVITKEDIKNTAVVHTSAAVAYLCRPHMEVHAVAKRERTFKQNISTF